jgi:hypothetical protein
MPAPEELGPVGAHLVGAGREWCRGQVMFAGGSEVAVIDHPRLLEVFRTDDVVSMAQLLETVTPPLVQAEADQATAGGSNPRFGAIFDGSESQAAPSAVISRCAVVSDRADMAAAVIAALEARGVSCHRVALPASDVGAASFAESAEALAATAAREGPLDAVVVALGPGTAAVDAGSGWERVLDEHSGIVEQIQVDAAWARATADYAKGADRAVRLLTLTDARTGGGRSRAQASAQLARAARTATHDRVTAFAVSLEGVAGSAQETDHQRAVGELAAHLVGGEGTPPLSGAELAAGDGWFGLRSHPRPTGSMSFGGPDVPTWLDTALRDLVGAAWPLEDRA